MLQLSLETASAWLEAGSAILRNALQDGTHDFSSVLLSAAAVALDCIVCPLLILEYTRAP